MKFKRKRGWKISFTEADCMTVLPLRLTFAYADKIIDMHERRGAERMLEDKQALEHAIQSGAGCIWLTVSEEEYRKLRISSSH